MTITDYTALGRTSGYLVAFDGASDVMWVPIKIPEEHKTAFQAAYLEGLEAAREAARKEEDRP